MVHVSLKPPDLHMIMNYMAGFPVFIPLLVYEEVHPRRIDLLIPNKTLFDLEIINGDILVFQFMPDSLDTCSVEKYYDILDKKANSQG